MPKRFVPTLSVPGLSAPGLSAPRLAARRTAAPLLTGPPLTSPRLLATLLSGCALLGALAVAAPPAHATTPQATITQATITQATSAPPRTIEVNRTLSADLAHDDGWRGHVSVQHTSERHFADPRSATSTDVERISVDVMLVRRSCDVGGCMETVLRTEPGQLTSRWSTRLTNARVASTETVPVRIRRYAVDEQGAITDLILEERIMVMPVSVAARSAGSTYTSVFSSVGGGVVTRAHSRQGEARITVTLGAMTVHASSGSISRDRRDTFPLAAAPVRPRR